MMIEIIIIIMCVPLFSVQSPLSNHDHPSGLLSLEFSRLFRLSQEGSLIRCRGGEGRMNEARRKNGWPPIADGATAAETKPSRLRLTTLETFLGFPFMNASCVRVVVLVSSHY